MAVYSAPFYLVFRFVLALLLLAAYCLPALPGYAAPSSNFPGSNVWIPSSGSSTSAQTPSSGTPVLNQYPQLPVLEQAWLGQTQDAALPVEQRLTALERFVFGQPKSQQAPTAQRYQTLLNVYKTQGRNRSVAFEPSLEPAPEYQEEKNTAVTEPPAYGSVASASKPTYASRPATPSSHNSELLTTLEQIEEKLLGKPFPSLSMEARTVQLEKMLFGSAQSGPLAPRIEAMASRLEGEPGSVPSSTNNTASASIPSVYSYPNVGTAGSYAGTPSVSSNPLLQTNPEDTLQRLAILEAKVYQHGGGGNPFLKANGGSSRTATSTLPVNVPGMPPQKGGAGKTAGNTMGLSVEQRLSQLEQAVFRTPAPPQLTAEARLERLETVIDASPSRTVRDVQGNQALQLALPVAFGLLLLLL